MPMPRQRRFLNVLAMVDGVRSAHPELAGPMRLAQLERVLAREGIAVLKLPIDARAYTIGGQGSYVIVVNSSLSGRHYSRVVAHEYAHIKLHRSAHEIEFDRASCDRGDPREYEAELFVLLLRLGPNGTPDHPDVARLVAKMEGAAARARTPEQLPLPLPLRPREASAAVATRPPTPVAHGIPAPPTPADLEAAYEDGLTYWRRQLAKRQPRRLGGRIGPPGTPVSEDLVRVKFYDETMRASRFTDREGRWWWIYNFRVVQDAAGHRHRERVRDFMSRDIEYRVFVNSLGVRRVYRFADRRENRDYRVKHLDRQLEHATPMPAKPRTRTTTPAHQ